MRTGAEEDIRTDELLFADEEDQGAAGAFEPHPWKVLVVDDEEEVHQATRLVLSDYEFAGRRLEFLSAYTGDEAKSLIDENEDTALVLLDVVMEDARAGLEVARYIRHDAQNRLVRIVLRTGQPGQAPEREVITDYDINDYKQKTELTSTKLFTTITTAIRSYRDLLAVDEARRSMNLLAMSVAHQIRNRTMAIAGFANILKRNASSGNGGSKYLESIVEESGRLEEVVGAVNAYSTCGPPDFSRIQLLPALENAVERFVAAAGRRGTEYALDMRTSPAVGMADGKMLSMALDALFDNVLDFVEGGEVVVLLQADSHGTVLEVLDRGPGIADQHMPHIFDPLFSTKPDGVGMGLCMMRKVGLEHGWDVILSNRPGGGVRAGYVIPRVEEVS